MRSTVTAVDLDLGVGNASTSGCEASDFASFPDGDIALIQRGGCSFALKAETAQAAGAVGVVIFNQGDTSAAARRNVFSGTLGQNTTTTIPVLSSSYDLGVVFSETDALELRLSANADDGTLTTRNVIAESLTGDPENVVMIGAHLRFSYRWTRHPGQRLRLSGYSRGCLTVRKCVRCQHTRLLRARKQRSDLPGGAPKNLVLSVRTSTLTTSLKMIQPDSVTSLSI